MPPRRIKKRVVQPSPPTENETGHRWPPVYGPPLFLALAVFLVYWPSLFSDLIYDARIIILREGFVTSLAHVGDVLSLKVLSSELMLGSRPGTLLYLMLIAAAWGRNAMGYHLAANVLHAANTALLFIVLRRLAMAELGSNSNRLLLKTICAIIAASLFFGLHPMAVETVSEVSFSSDLLATFFTLLTIWSATVFQPEKVYAKTVAALGITCAFAAVLCKESGLAATALLFIYWFLYRRMELRQPWFWFLGITAVVISTYFTARLLLVPSTADFPVQYLGGSFSHVFTMQPGLWVFMMGKLVWPVHLSADYTLQDNSGPPTWISILILLMVFAAQGWLASRSRLAALGMAFFWLGLGTVSNLVPMYHPLADRFYYLPLTGIAMELLALLLMLSQWRYVFWSATGFLLAVALPFLFLTLERQPVFVDERSVWIDVLEESPHSMVAHYNLAMALMRDGKFTIGSVSHLEEALKVYPNFVQAHTALGAALEQEGRRDEAISHYQRALELNPHYEEAHASLGLALLHEGKTDEALTQCETALQIDPRRPEAHYNLGLVLAQKGNLDAAIDQYRQAFALDPGNAEAHYSMAAALAQKGDFANAVAEYQTALRINPRYSDALNNLGNLFLQAGRLDQAIGAYEEAIRIQPDAMEAHNNLGVARLRTGNYAAAAEQFREALRLRPGYPDAQKNLEATLEAEKKQPINR